MNFISNFKSNIAAKRASYQALDSREKAEYWKDALINNAIYILIILAIIYTQYKNSYFLTTDSIVNIISLSAGIWRTISRALPLVQIMSLSSFTPAPQFM